MVVTGWQWPLFLSVCRTSKFLCRLGITSNAIPCPSVRWIGVKLELFLLQWRSLVLVDGYMQVLPYRRDNEDNDVDSGWQGVRVVSVLLCGSFGEVMVSRRAETESQQTLAAKRETSQQRQTKSTTSQPSNRTVNQRNSPCIRSTVSSLRKAAHC